MNIYTNNYIHNDIIMPILKSWEISQPISYVCIAQRSRDLLSRAPLRPPGDCPAGTGHVSARHRPTRRGKGYGYGYAHSMMIHGSETQF